MPPPNFDELGAVQLRSSAGGDGVVPGDDPSRIGGRLIVVAEDPKPGESGERQESFSLVIDGPNDRDIIQAQAEMAKRGPIKDINEATTAVYRRAAELKRLRRAAAAGAAPAPALKAHDADYEVEAAESPYRPAQQSVTYVLEGGGTFDVSYESVTVEGDTAVLVSPVPPPGVGSYTPPKSSGADLRPIDLILPGESEPSRAYMVHSPYVVAGRRHVILAIER